MIRAALHLDPPLAAIPGILAGDGLACFQTTLRDPQRYGSTGVPDEDDQAAYRDAVQEKPLWGIVHGSLLVNLASPEGRIRNSSVSSVVGDLKLAATLGLHGVCFHIGYQRGHAERSAALAQATKKLVEVLEKRPAGVRVLLENACEGTELGTDLPEVGQIVRDAGAGAEALGVVVDTCHLHAAGFDLSGPEAGDRLAGALGAEGLLDRLAGFHLNDCQGAVGCRRDRHAPPGEGSINEGLVAIGRHEAFRDVPAILELEPSAARRGIAWLARAGVLT